MSVSSSLPIHLSNDRGLASTQRLPELDGWRAVSILAVLAGHMLPLGPKDWMMNSAVAAAGLAIFFTLSGFLMVSILHSDPNVKKFLVRRVARIVPLTWLCLVIVLTVNMADPMTWIANALFFANLPPYYLQYTGHLWSISLEVQFYVLIGIIVMGLGKRGLYTLPIFAVVVTLLRFAHGKTLAIDTWYRLDEILAGGTLALIVINKRLPTNVSYARVAPYIVLPLLVASSHDKAETLAYFRPYLAVALVGSSFISSPPWLHRWLRSSTARYLADVSFALYVIHPYTISGWFGSGDTWQRYAKRPIAFALLFGLAHLSTFYYERWWRALAHPASLRGR